MIFYGLIHWVDIYDDFEGVFAVGMVEMDKRIYLDQIQERQDQQDDTQFCSLEVIRHGYSGFTALTLAPLMTLSQIISVPRTIIRLCSLPASSWKGLSATIRPGCWTAKLRSVRPGTQTGMGRPDRF
jgi:hypothetical protein